MEHGTFNVCSNKTLASKDFKFVLSLYTQIMTQKYVVLILDIVFLHDHNQNTIAVCSRIYCQKLTAFLLNETTIGYARKLHIIVNILTQEKRQVLIS
jgi:hypothetical protein